MCVSAEERHDIKLPTPVIHEAPSLSSRVKRKDNFLGLEFLLVLALLTRARCAIWPVKAGSNYPENFGGGPSPICSNSRNEGQLNKNACMFFLSLSIQDPVCTGPILQMSHTVISHFT